MSDLLKLENIRLRNGDIKAFVLESNMTAANTGKDNWGRIEIAVDNETVHRLMNDDVIGVLYVTTKEEWEKEKNT